ncbi:hypothetical protein FSP39_007115 [Pinctada imbricata]|uniref:Arrestin C-terminal-like domain-containing protein n=1 Tax=Pinctada imbricata TaxID=66713 RepID=A0AA88YHS8_PINIB|nr:hypothetical protein FSP39_007115 [Pinctada imbricata]
MIRPSYFQINFMESNGIFKPGNIIKADLDLILDRPLKLAAIRIYAKGKAFVHWTNQNMRGPGSPRYKVVRHYSANEEYFDFVCTVLKSEEHNKRIILPPGKYSYPFQFQLPPNLPSSFEGQYGYVRYWVKATVEKPWSFDHVTKTAFSVISALDLNSLPDANTSVRNGSHAQLCCLCCLSGPITAQLSLERRGFVSGEPILINAEVDNMSRRKIRQTSVALKMTTTFHSGTKSRSITTQLAKIQHGPVGRGNANTWNEEKLYLPPLPPSFLLGCSIIDIHYTLELQVDPVGPGFEILVPVEIIIGTVPLHSSIQHHARVSQYGADSGTGDLYRTSTTAPERLEFFNSLSVTYSDSIFGSVSIKEDDDPEYTRGNLHFTPVYTFYIWNNYPTT